MKLGVLTVLFQDKSLDETLDIVKSLGLDAVELGTGNYPGNAHCNPDELLADETKIAELQRKLDEKGLIISALSCHGNPLHPQKEVAQQFHDTWRKTVLLAEKLGIDCINVFSGCPGDSDQSLYPNWVTCAWPPDYLEILNWQWEQKLTPYWKEEAAFANQHHVSKIAFEMHPGFMVYNPETLLRLREAVGNSIGANFDPSHLLWQGIDPVEAIKLLGKHGAIFHAHAKDVYLDRTNIQRNGVLDTKPYGDIMNRSWTFRSVGYGMQEATWKQIVSMLRVVGYDGVLSIEHEDALASVEEGFAKAVEMLKRSILRESPGEMWWA
ncbi:sugar phosphate isomerase/epimerase [Aneurinibacillus sp. Ricciae_BoGa-3]|uniref:sugar phosphate isomerase/epimerase family protein n=1 Tax=Aneurinibacillus sp. Ricciae_BoGa-3 TaxID=3022697 RepID=UPI00234160FE|nr:sugar phosphate isomerase/epimerase [Aneurinibacillus sp. Ricciae_BoGa-3]WCK56852.1 sugar phosphate isomerase/epimerase [Aneurinibacillus sp. Ricciae_BoGa-3]